MTVRDWLTVEMAAGGIICAVFVCLYAWRSPWRSTAVGRHMMTFMVVLMSIFVLWLVHRAVHPLPALLWLAAIGVFDAVLLWRVVLLWRAQHRHDG